MRWPTLLGVVGFGGMGALALAHPRSVAGLVDLGIESEMSQNEVRAVYGGFGMAMAASLLAEGVGGRPAAAHRMCALALTGMATGRIIDIAMRRGEGELARPAMYAGAESAIAAALLSATITAGQEPEPEPG